MPPSSRSRALSWPNPRHANIEKDLRASNTAWFKARGVEVNPRMPYLLSRWEDWPNNIIVPAVYDMIKAEREERQKNRAGFPLHKYIHHGLSSQAMLFNLVGPLLVTGDFSPLKQAFNRAGIPWPNPPISIQLEIEDREVFNESSGQATSIDLAIETQNGKGGLFIEAKLVERAFGGCSVFAEGDCSGASPVLALERCYLHYLGREYWNLLEKHGFVDGPMGSSPICPLASYYQFFRELLFALEKDGDFVLLYDQRNPVFHTSDGRGLMPFLLTFVPPDLRSRVHSITIQQVVSAFDEYKELTWLRSFKEKYGMLSTE